ncbi:MAG: hypothetical protein EPO35_02165 [Acidobacteria bacterium]|nr:MAG: hypothetical protein EPO35_02165 [Acidobacteriota bacterium]
MKITRDVINDLLPVYLAGEASNDTRALLEDYLRSDPALAAEVRQQAEKSAALLGALSTSLPPDHERETFERIRRHQRERNQWLVFGLVFALAPLTFVFGSEGIEWVMMRDNPKQAAFFLAASAGCFIARALTGRKTSRTA